MKIITQKLFSLLMIFTLTLSNFLPFIPMPEVYALTSVDEIRITSSTTSVEPGELPEFSATTTTEHASIDTNNTGWSRWGATSTTWMAFGNATPTAIDDGKTHYGLTIAVDLQSGYAFDENTKIIFNGTDVTSLGHSSINPMTWGGYVNIDLGTAGAELPKYTVSFDSNGGTGTKKSLAVYAGESVSLGNNTFTPPTGMSFESWRIGNTDYEQHQQYTPTSDTIVKAIWTDKYIRESRATMTPSTISSEISANDLLFTSSEPSKYNVALWRVFDKTDTNLNTDNGKYPNDAKFIAGHQYAIEFDFTAAGNYYEYDETTDGRTSTFYLNNQATGISAAVAVGGSTHRRIELTATNGSATETHSVIFHLNGGIMTSSDNIEVNHGAIIALPSPNPTKDGNTFGGWYEDAEFTVPFETSKQINEDTELFAKWNANTPETYTVTFKDGNTVLDSRNIQSGSTVQRPNPDPTKGGYTFDNWYANAELNVLFDFSQPITANTEIFAKYDENAPQQQTIRFQLDGATVSGNVITFQSGETQITATPTGTGFSFDGNNLIVNTSDLNNVKLALSDNFDSSKMKLKLHDQQELTITGDNEAIFDGLDFSLDNSPHLGLYTENSGGQEPIGGTEDITFNITVNNTYALVDINGKEVVGEGGNNQETYTFNNVLVEEAGESDPTKTNVIKITPSMGEHNISECTINNVVYTLESENVEYRDYGWFITVPGSDNYNITVTGDVNSETQKTIIWVNPDYVPENEEDAEWVSNFTISHGTAKVIEVYDKEDHLVDPSTYVGEGSDEYGLRDGFGWVAVYPGSRVIFEFVPEYGYQLTGIAINETPLEAINGNENMNRFEVVLPAENAGNLHFAATFTPTEDIVKAESEKVTSGEINLGNNLNGGSAQLTVNDITLGADKIAGFKNAAGNYTISNYLDIDLYNVFYKGKNDAEDVWTNKIDELENEATISLKLADNITADDIVLVHNIHDGEEFEIIEIESYDPITNTITFKTKSFSNYAIATKTSSSNSNDNSNTNANTNNNSNTNTNTNTNPQTYDGIFMWISLFIISLIGLAIGTFKFKKEISK